MWLNFLRDHRIPLRLRKKLGRLFPLPKNQPFSITLHGAHYGGVTGNLVDDKVYLYGSHEAATLRLIRAILSYTRAQGRPTTYVDIGVNSGLHLICAGQHCDRAIGFEPWEKILSIAQDNIRRNPGMAEHCQIFPFGLSDQDEILPFHPPLGNNLGVGSFRSFAEASSTTIPLPLRQGDPVMAEHDIHPTLIKIDTEGFEDRVLRGLQKTITQSRPAIIFEYGPLSHPDFRDAAHRQTLFPGVYTLYGLRRSREYPALTPFRATDKYENVLAWPYPEDPRLALRRFI